MGKALISNGEKENFMLQYQIVSTDLDGTLLLEDGSISPQNQAAMAALSAAGVFVVPNTGRTLEEIPHVVRENPEVRYIIHSDGAVIYDKQTGKRDLACVSGADCRRVLDILRRYPCSFSMRSGGAGFVRASEHNEADYISYHVDRSYRDFLYRYSHPVEDFDAFCDRIDEIEMICTFFRTEEDASACYRELAATGLLQLIASGLQLEVFAADAGKGNALLRLARSLGMAAEATVAVGDGTNDSDAIRCAGLGLAMANAVPTLKAEADAVICHVTEHAIDHIAKRYIFQNI
jgi:Cof subfamily protein (haloacid dehalogenase superfamily)